MTDDTKKTIADLTTEEFNELIDGFIQREDDRIEPSTFLKAVAELERERAREVIEITGKLVDGEIIFDEPAPLPVGRSSIFFGDTQIVMKIRQL